MDAFYFPARKHRQEIPHLARLRSRQSHLLKGKHHMCMVLHVEQGYLSQAHSMKKDRDGLCQHSIQMLLPGKGCYHWHNKNSLNTALHTLKSLTSDPNIQNSRHLRAKIITPYALVSHSSLQPPTLYIFSNMWMPEIRPQVPLPSPPYLAFFPSFLYHIAILVNFHRNTGFTKTKSKSDNKCGLKIHPELLYWKNQMCLLQTHACPASTLPAARFYSQYGIQRFNRVVRKTNKKCLPL